MEVYTILSDPDLTRSTLVIVSTQSVGIDRTTERYRPLMINHPFVTGTQTLLRYRALTLLVTFEIEVFSPLVNVAGVPSAVIRSNIVVFLELARNTNDPFAL